jgi:hypothetical protein
MLFKPALNCSMSFLKKSQVAAERAGILKIVSEANETLKKTPFARGKAEERIALQAWRGFWENRINELTKEYEQVSSRVASAKDAHVANKEFMKVSQLREKILRAKVEHAFVQAVETNSKIRGTLEDLGEFVQVPVCVFNLELSSLDKVAFFKNGDKTILSALNAFLPEPSIANLLFKEYRLQQPG